MSLRETFETQGYAVAPDFLGDDFAELQRQVERYVREVAPTLTAQDAFYGEPGNPETLRQLHRMERDPYFAACLKDSRWCELAASLLGESVEPIGAEWFNKMASASHPTPPHQDNFYFCLAPPRVLTMWLALDEVDTDNGCLRYSPGSHRFGIRDHSPTATLGFSQGIVDYDPSDEVAVRAKPGDLLIHHGNTIHRADANLSPRPRRSFAIVFRGASCQRDMAAFARYQAALAKQQQAKQQQQ